MAQNTIDDSWYSDDPELSSEEVGRQKLFHDLAELNPITEWLSDDELLQLHHVLA